MMCQCDDPGQIQIVHETGFFVMRITSYGLDMSMFENFPKWLDNFFYLNFHRLDDLTVFYFIRAFINLIYFDNIDVDQLVRKGYPSIIEQIIQASQELSDSTVYNMLKLMKELVYYDRKRVGFDVELIFRLGMSGMKTSSPYVFKFFQKVLKNDGSILRIMPTDNGIFPDKILPSVISAFGDMNFEMKMAVLGFLRSLLYYSDIHQSFVLGKTILGFYAQTLWETDDDKKVVASILLGVDDILTAGTTQGRENEFAEIMYRFNTIEFLEKTFMDEEDEGIAAQAKGILYQYFPEAMEPNAGDEIYDNDDYSDNNNNGDFEADDADI